MKKHSRIIVTSVLTLILSLSAGLTAWAGTWQYDGPENWQWKYVKDDGTTPSSCWEQIDGSWYHFDSNAYLDIGFTYDSEYESYYYLNDKDGSDLGKMVTSGQWEYGYIEPDGRVHCYFPSYSDPYASTGDIGLYEPTQYDEEAQYNPFVSASTNSWYNEIFTELSTMLNWDMPEGQEVTRQFQLPENWREVCPAPFINALVSFGVNKPWEFIDGEGTHYNWNIENNVLHVTAYWLTYEEYY